MTRAAGNHLGELASAYLDGETSAAESLMVVEHLADCERCRLEMADLHAARSALRSLPVLELPVGLLAGVGPPAEVVPLRRRPLSWVAAAAAAIIVFVAAATASAPDVVGITLDDVSLQYQQQQLHDPVITQNLGQPTQGGTR